MALSEKVTKEKLKKNWIWILASALAVVLLVVCLLPGGNKADTTIPQMPETPDRETKYNYGSGLKKVEMTVDTSVIKERFQEIGILETYCYTADELQEVTKDGLFSWNITSAQYLIQYTVELRAGIDCTKIKIDADHTAKKITIGMPKAFFQKPTIDYDSCEQYEVKQGLFSKLNWDDFNISMTELEEAAVEKAEKNGVLKKADENARTLILNLVSQFPNAEEYSIEFTTIN